MLPTTNSSLVFIQLLTSPAELETYGHWIKTHPQGSLWQSLEWKKYQESLGREVRIYGAKDTSYKLQATSLVVIDRTNFGLSTWNIPRGPVGMGNEEWGIENMLTYITRDGQNNKCMSLFFSPFSKIPILHSSFSTFNSSRHEQPEATRILDLTLSEDQILAQMHQKGRYNIKVAQKNGVHIKQSHDVDAYYELAKKTAGRDGFGIPSKRQLKAFLEHLPGSFLLLAYSSGSPKFSESPIAGLIGITWGATGIYYYGASDYEHRALMAPYLLQWEAIKYCKAHGCKGYDLLGIAPPDATSNHHWAGISSFKEKFGGTVITYPPEQQIILRPMMQKLLTLKRKITR